MNKLYIVRHNIIGSSTTRCFLVKAQNTKEAINQVITRYSSFEPSNAEWSVEEALDFVTEPIYLGRDNYCFIRVDSWITE